mmetsp:Transcript_5544/g.34316  ORF Transcript_5544/g.34316 Transcript_5544/m.34316 type:complete len:197 (+) Transcript_5544:459-1049(+)
MHQTPHLVGHLGVQEPAERHERVLASTHHRTRAAETQDVVGGTRSTRIPPLGCRHPHRKGMMRPPIQTRNPPSPDRPRKRIVRAIDPRAVEIPRDSSVGWSPPRMDQADARSKATSRGHRCAHLLMGSQCTSQSNFCLLMGNVRRKDCSTSRNVLERSDSDLAACASSKSTMAACVPDTSSSVVWKWRSLEYSNVH